MYKGKFADQTIDTTKLSADDKDEYKMWLKVKKKIEGDGNEEGVDLVHAEKSIDLAPRKATAQCVQS